MSIGSPGLVLLFYGLPIFALIFIPIGIYYLYLRIRALRKYINEERKDKNI